MAPLHSGGQSYCYRYHMTVGGSFFHNGSIIDMSAAHILGALHCISEVETIIEVS